MMLKRGTPEWQARKLAVYGLVGFAVVYLVFAASDRLLNGHGPLLAGLAGGAASMLTTRLLGWLQWA